MPVRCEFGTYCCGGTCGRYCHRPATKYLDFKRPEAEIQQGRLAGIHFCDKHYDEEVDHFVYRREEFLTALREYGERKNA